ncbi:MAG TPA: hypothetical protein V6D13_14990 [Halomicronema sp.]
MGLKSQISGTRLTVIGAGDLIPAPLFPLSSITLKLVGMPYLVPAFPSQTGPSKSHLN